MRAFCTRCLRAQKTCYCPEVRPFRTQIQFVILQHPLEQRKSIGTARMAYHSIENSRLIIGSSFDDNSEVMALIANPALSCSVVFPGPGSRNLSLLCDQEIRNAFVQDLQQVFFIIDGTWRCAKRMMQESRCLSALPQICFSPEFESEYKIRQQPEKHYVSTIEAIHQLIRILEPSVDSSSLMTLFRSMVDRQIQYSKVYQELRNRLSNAVISENC